MFEISKLNMGKELGQNSTHNRVLEVDANFRSVAGKVQLRQVARKVRYAFAVKERRKQGKKREGPRTYPAGINSQVVVLWGSNSSITKVSATPS